MNVGIVGLGLIGGSIGKDLKNNLEDIHIIGVDSNDLHRSDAKQLGLVDETLELEEMISRSQIIILAVPVNVIKILLPQIMDTIDQQIVFDVGSTKHEITQTISNHPNRGRYVACHPMAGTEYSGPKAAVSNLFEGKFNVFCDVDESDSDALQTVEKLFESLKMIPLYQDSKAHDQHVAYVSHMSHISSFALGLTVLHKEKSEDQILKLASGGFRSTVRLAKSNPETWVPIFEQNRDNVLDVLDEHITVLSKFRSLLIKKDFNGFRKLMNEAGEIKRILN